MDNLILTIAIPTYNRAALLDKCLAAIEMQFESVSAQVGIIISNNAATDHTRDIVEKYRGVFQHFHYNENQTNTGPDLNIAKCFELAATKYVWVFSDDDILLPGTLAPIVGVLEKQELGLLNLTPTWYGVDVADATIPDEPFTHRVYEDPLEYMQEVNYWTTFITSNIINKSLVADLSTLYQYKGTNLMQLGWTLPAIFRATHNAKVFSLVVLGRAAPEGVDYRFFKVFSLNFNEVLAGLIKSGVIPPAARDIINLKLIANFFPQYLSPGRKFPADERPFNILFQAFKGYREFWLDLVPLFIKRYYDAPLGRLKQAVKQLVLGSYDRMGRSSAYQRTQRSVALLKAFGVNSQLPEGHTFTSPQRISIGRRFVALPHLRIEVREEHTSTKFDAQVFIGDDVHVGLDCHISCINQVVIGSHVLIGNRVTITDNAPDDQPAARVLRPMSRLLVSRGPVIIGANVLIEDGASIRSGVLIGENAVIKAGAVVTVDIAANAIVAGNPAQKL